MIPTEQQTDYERADVSPRLVLGLAGVLLALVVVTLVALRLAYTSAFVDQGTKGPTKPLPPQPRLQVDDVPDMAALRHEEDSRLASYGWVDRPTGTARMPVDEAIRMTAERGLPKWTKADR